jgi:hypothetical protein
LLSHHLWRSLHRCALCPRLLLRSTSRSHRRESLDGSLLLLLRLKLRSGSSLPLCCVAELLKRTFSVGRRFSLLWTCFIKAEHRPEALPDEWA